MRNLRAVLIAASLLTIASCASTGENKAEGIAAFKDVARLGEKVDKICFNRNIDGFSSNERKTVVLSSGVNKDYIVEVRGVCSNLSHARSIGIDSSLSCVRRGDYLIVSDSAFSLNDGAGIGPDRCLIDRIHKWDKKAEQREDDI